MTSPRNSNTARGGQRVYTWRSENYWSVTTIIGGGVPKPALLPWGIKMVAEGAADMAAQLPAMVAQDRDAAVRFLKGLPYAKRDRAADVGTYIHAAAEAYKLGQPFPKWAPEARPRMEAYVQFLEDFGPEYEATEASVFNRTEWYAGTLDAICTIGGRKFLIDTKTGKGVYPETALQLAAYRYAEFIGLPDGSEAPMPPVDGCACLHLTDDGYELLDVHADEDVFKSFLYVREVFRWQTELGQRTIGPPLIPSVPSPEAVA
ncbi:MAG: hypothetical protein ACRDQW_17490 [Haloechinothrix sp.]